MPLSNPLQVPHQPIIAELSPDHLILASSVISSSKIRKRVTQVHEHLTQDKESTKPRVSLLYARTADVCKLITIVEQCKRLLEQEGKKWYQYNQMFDVPEQKKTKRIEIVEETVLEGGTRMEDEEREEEDDAFEVMGTRFEQAIMPPPPRNTVKSLRVFLTLQRVPGLERRAGVTTQSCEVGNDPKQ